MSPPSGGDSPELLGAILAGGKSRRFGTSKAAALLAGRPMAAWAAGALEPHFSHRGILTRDAEVARELELRHRPDGIPGQGPLGGLLTALDWAREEGLGGVFLLACDLPLVDETVVGRILAHGFGGQGALVPASPGPLGVEPLCAAYSLECREPARTLLEEGRRAMKALLDRVGCSVVPLEALGGAEAAGIWFKNVNTPGEGREAEELLVRRWARTSGFIRQRTST